jgi:hypothetical protein
MIHQTSSLLCTNTGPCAKAPVEEAHVGLLGDVEPRMLET